MGIRGSRTRAVPDVTFRAMGGGDVMDTGTRPSPEVAAVVRRLWSCLPHRFLATKRSARYKAATAAQSAASATASSGVNRSTTESTCSAYRHRRGDRHRRLASAFDLRKDRPDNIMGARL